MSGKHRLTRRARTLGAALALGLVAGACSSTASTAGKQNAPSPGITARLVTVGSHQPLTGPTSPGNSEVAAATAAFFQYVDGHGGVGGRQIAYRDENDAGNATDALTAVRRMVDQEKVFAVVNGYGTAPHQGVVKYLNQQQVPDLFVGSGCTCWNAPNAYPHTFGFQPDYPVDGKVLGRYLEDHYRGHQFGYVNSSDDLGTQAVAGLDQEIPRASVVSRQAVPSGTTPGAAQIAALQAAGAAVVVVETDPAGLAALLLAADAANFHPQWALGSSASDPAVVGQLLTFASQGKAGASLLEGAIGVGYLPTPTDPSNPWIALFHQVHDSYEKDQPFDSYAVYGMAVAYTFTEALHAAGANPNRPSVVAALESKGHSFTGPGLAPFGFSASNHGGYSGAQIGIVQNGVLGLAGPVYETADTGAVTTQTLHVTTPPSSF